MFCCELAITFFSFWEMVRRSQTISGAIRSVTTVSDTLCHTSITLKPTICRESRTKITADLAALESATFASFTNFDAMRPVELF